MGYSQSAADGVDAVWEGAGLVLVDTVDVAQTMGPREFVEYPPGASRMEEILGVPTRVIEVKAGDQARYFAFRVGAGKELKPGRAYVLEIDFPEDLPRSMLFWNHGCGTIRGVHTGSTVGDPLHPLHVTVAHESLDLPLSGEQRTWRMFFPLHDRVSPLKRHRGDGMQLESVEGGFWVVVGHYGHKHAPDSAGAAVSAIRMYAVGDEAALAVEINYPPEGLPRRHVFWREEAADIVIDSPDPEQREVVDVVDWYENQARLMRVLGFNTYTRDLLEFGSNQGWDSSKYGGDVWYFQSNRPHSWSGVLERLSRDYPEFYVMPMFEYMGSLGSNGLGQQKRARPLDPGLESYTHVAWAEKGRADMADPATLEDMSKLLDVTIVEHKDKVKFAGAWLRARPGAMPVSFNENNLRQFAAEANGGVEVTRGELQERGEIYQRYLEWWNDRRKAFLNGARDFLRTAGVGEDVVVLYTADFSEAGLSISTGAGATLVAESPQVYKDLGERTMTRDEILAGRYHERALTEPLPTWGKWEWEHAAPTTDPENYQDNEGVLPTYTFNRGFTAVDEGAMERFRTDSGLALVRHYSLNEHMFHEMEDGKRKDLLGFFATDMERAGPYVMMAEALAVAHGDPRYIGYLSGHRFNTGSPEYVRKFTRAFLSLPALPAVVDKKLSSNPEVVVRVIESEDHGTWLAVVNTSREDAGATITLPTAGSLSDAASGKPLKAENGKVELDLYPFQLRALHIRK